MERPCKCSLTVMCVVAVAGFATMGCGAFQLPGTDGNTTGDATQGAQTFADNCAVCHGSDGTGGFGPNVTGKSAAEIAAELTGSHGGGAFPALTDQDYEDIVAFLQQ